MKSQLKFVADEILKENTIKLNANNSTPAATATSTTSANSTTSITTLSNINTSNTKLNTEAKETSSNSSTPMGTLNSTSSKTATATANPTPTTSNLKSLNASNSNTSSDPAAATSTGASATTAATLDLESFVRDWRHFECQTWHLEPTVRLLSWAGKSIEPYGIDYILNKLGFSHARTTIPKWLQRGFMDPLDKVQALMMLQLLLMIRENKIETSSSTKSTSNP